MAADTIEGAELALTIGPTLDTMMMRGALPGERMPLTRAIVDAICRDQPLDPHAVEQSRMSPAELIQCSPPLKDTFDTQAVSQPMVLIEANAC